MFGFGFGWRWRNERWGGISLTTGCVTLIDLFSLVQEHSAGKLLTGILIPPMFAMN